MLKFIKKELLPDMDFLIIYEHAGRELESACYLSTTLQKLGYKVKVINERYLFRIFLRPRVVVVPYLYSDVDVDNFNTFLFKKKINIVNLQHEQILNDAAIRTGFHIPKGMAKYGFHICWGRNTYNRLLSNGVPQESLCVTGNLGMDLNRTELRSCLRSKEELANLFDLDTKKNWHLFISSFVLNDLSEQEISVIVDKLPGYDAFVDVSKKSKGVILDWMAHYARKHKDTIIIYRPHPAEKSKQIIFTDSIDNFRCISDFSIRQWVAVADSCSTWFSTSIVDCYFARKNCCILRPVEIPTCFDEKFFIGGHFLCAEKEFENFVLNPSSADFPIESEHITDNYGVMCGSSMFVDNVANTCIRALHSTAVYSRKISSVIICLKKDIIAFIFRLFPHFLEGKEDFKPFREKVIRSKGDKKMMDSYLSIFMN